MIQSGSSLARRLSVKAHSLCLCVFLLFPGRRKDSFHPVHSCRVQATGSAPVPRERRPALVCHAISRSQGWPVWEKLCGCIPKSALHALLFFLPSLHPEHTMKTTAAATDSSPPSQHKAALSHLQSGLCSFKVNCFMATKCCLGISFLS